MIGSQLSSEVDRVCKRCISFILLLIASSFIVSCSFSKEQYPITKISGYRVDMSAYKGMNSVDHCFVGITPEEALELINDKGSAVFYLGSASCPNCQEAVKLINEAAEDTDITIYYLDCYSDVYPLTPYIDRFESAMGSVLPERNGEKGVYMPWLFTIKAGTPSENYCGVINGYDGSKESDRKMIEIYKGIMEGFIK